jgi:heterodisulfide reductase subunit A-like polyferredoxin
MAKIMKLNKNPEGYFIEAHVKLRPVDMGSDGVFLCGTAHGPKLITETIAQANAAASRAVTFLAKDQIKLSAIKAEVDTDNCVKCLTCVRSCPFEVPFSTRTAGEIQIDRRCAKDAAFAPACARARPSSSTTMKTTRSLSKIDALLAGGM